MNFSITINGEGPELGKALATLKQVLGDQVGSGSVTAQIAPAAVQPAAAAPVQTTTPQQAAEAYQAQQTYVPPVAPVAPLTAPAPSTPGAVPTAPAPSYTMEQLGVAAGPLVEAGRSAELTAWLNQRGAGALSQLDKAYYGDFAAYLRSLGAQI